MKFRDAIKLAFSPSEFHARWELERIRKLPRYKPGQTRLLGKPLGFADSSSYYFMHEEIFVQKIYAFKTDNPAPRIIDGGANIGLATIFLKNCYPMARITAFEADPTIAAILRSNLMSQGISDVEIQEAALWSESGKILFNSEGADGGKIGHQKPDSLYVKTLPLLNFLHEPIDFLKLDIEGAEFEVLSSCGDKLAAVRKAFIEYHSQIGGPQYLPELLYLLKKSGFRCFISTPSVFNPRPLEASKSYNGFDMVLNLFCVRPEF